MKPLSESPSNFGPKRHYLVRNFRFTYFVLIYTNITYTAVKSDLPVKLDTSMGSETQAQFFVLQREDGFPILPENIDPETIPPKLAQILVKDYIEKAWRT
jgi:hypothetical protein